MISKKHPVNTRLHEHKHGVFLLCSYVFPACLPTEAGECRNPVIQSYVLSICVWLDKDGFPPEPVLGTLSTGMTHRITCNSPYFQYYSPHLNSPSGYSKDYQDLSTFFFKKRPLSTCYFLLLIQESEYMPLAHYLYESNPRSQSCDDAVLR